MDMKKLTRVLMLILGIWVVNYSAKAQNNQKINPDKSRTVSFRLKASKKVVIGKKGVEIKVQMLNKDRKVDAGFSQSLPFTINKKDISLKFTKGEASLKDTVTFTKEFVFKHKNTVQKTRIKYFPAWLSILPALLAIAFALIFREVIVSIFTGIFLGAWILSGFGIGNLIPAVLTVLDTYLLKALYNESHISIILFTMAIGGIVAIVSKNGGMAGVVKILSRLANSARNTQLVTWLLGIAIFFDDYANTLIVGNTMRPITDRYRISREKLAYIVDSTSAPVAAIAFVTTWIGAELSQIQDAVKGINQTAPKAWVINEGAYSIFLKSLEYSFYPILAVLFMLILLYTRRDFGAMYKAEMRARRTGEVNLGEAPESAEASEANREFEPVKKDYIKWYNALVPIMFVIGGTIVGLVYTGMDAASVKLGTGEVWGNLAQLNQGQEPSFIRKIGMILGMADSYVTLLWASLMGLIVAILLTVSQRIMSLQKTMEAMVMGFKTVLPPVLILLFAWALAKVNGDLGTGDYLSNFLLEVNMSAYWLPVVTFVLAAIVAFSTGSSWGTMAILYPLILPAVWTAAQSGNLEVENAMSIFYHVTSVVLAGSVFGDHCSPISDTTILSSLASGCNHIEHVRTQLPYALTVASVSILASSLFFMIGLPWYITYLVCIGMLIGIVRFLGKPVPEPEQVG